MNKITNKIFLATLVLVLFNNITLAQEMKPNFNKIPPPQIHHKKPTAKQQKEFDKLLDERLKLTKEQKEYIAKNRPKHIKEMEETIKKMDDLHKKIGKIYNSNNSKFQADLQTASMKTELAILKQNAIKQKRENRKNFENILTKEQKIEFEKLRKELAQKRAIQPPSERWLILFFKFWNNVLKKLRYNSTGFFGIFTCFRTGIF